VLRIVFVYDIGIGPKYQTAGVAGGGELSVVVGRRCRPLAGRFFRARILGTLSVGLLPRSKMTQKSSLTSAKCVDLFLNLCEVLL